MHELANCRRLVKMSEQQAQQFSVDRIKRIIVSVGAMSGIDIDELLEMMPDVARNTCLDGAEIIVERQPLVMECLSCSKEYEPIEVAESCPYCASGTARLKRGTEFILKSIDIETESA